LENLQAIYPDNLIVVDCHLADEFENPDTVERSLLYGIWGLPTVQVDGKYAQIGAASCEEVQEIFQGFVQRDLRHHLGDLRSGRPGSPDRPDRHLVDLRR
jgi:hypothetical protein